MAARPKRYDSRRQVRKLARERVGKVPASRIIEPRTARKKPKHKKPHEEAESV